MAASRAPARQATELPAFYLGRVSSAISPRLRSQSGQIGRSPGSSSVTHKRPGSSPHNVLPASLHRSRCAYGESGQNVYSISSFHWVPIVVRGLTSIDETTA
jgi:hypothetical protein